MDIRYRFIIPTLPKKFKRCVNQIPIRVMNCIRSPNKELRFIVNDVFHECVQTFCTWISVLSEMLTSEILVINYTKKLLRFRFEIKIHVHWFKRDICDIVLLLIDVFKLFQFSTRSDRLWIYSICFFDKILMIMIQDSRIYRVGQILVLSCIKCLEVYDVQINVAASPSAE